MFEIFVKGGFIMYPIAALSVYVAAAIIFKSVHFWRVNILNTRFVGSALHFLSEHNVRDAYLAAQRSKNPVARVVEAALANFSNTALTKQQAEEEIARVGAAELHKLETHLKGLEMAASVGPLLGLLGTVVGMVSAFSILEQAGAKIDPSLLAGGIWTALLTTVAGLTVAIPAVAAHYVFDGLIERTRINMQDATARIATLFAKLHPAALEVAGIPAKKPAPREAEPATASPYSMGSIRIGS